MKIYTTAQRESECHGHGDYGTETKITRLGAYGEGHFPPCFLTREETQEWLDDYKANGEFKYYMIDSVIVELELKHP